MKPIDDYIINFLLRKETPEDVENLKKWLAIDPSHREELKKWLVTWDAAKLIDANEKIDVKKAYERFEARIANETEEKPYGKVVKLRTNTMLKTVMRIAAVFATVFMLGIVGYYFFVRDTNSSSNVFVEIIVPLGSQEEIKLPDGSVVLLNAGSSLSYPSDYGKKSRNVHLTGEGYFKVLTAKNIFTVNTEQAQIVVTGTEFNVRAYLDEDKMETTLIRGEIAVKKEGSETVSMTSGQKLSVKGNEIIVKQLDPETAEAEASWKEKEWRIEAMTLNDLAIRLSKRFDVNIHVNENVKNIHFSGTFKNETLEEMLWVIEASTEINYRIEGDNVHIE